MHCYRAIHIAIPTIDLAPNDNSRRAWHREKKSADSPYYDDPRHADGVEDTCHDMVG
jgi:hypothetical protein